MSAEKFKSNSELVDYQELTEKGLPSYGIGEYLGKAGIIKE